jgi:peptide/nickel transport system substrate-binding protein
MKTLRDVEAATVALEAGTALIVWSTAANAQRLKNGTGTTAATLRASGSHDILMSTVDAPFSNKRVRQAMNLALDRKRFVDTLMYGLTEPTHIIWLRSSPAWDPAIDIGEFNLEKARQLLDEAGYGRGFETRIQTNGAYPELSKFAAIVQADLAKIGVKLNIEPTDAVQANAW